MQVEIMPIKAGGAYSIVISGKNSIILENELIGDVWMGSGQSNMSFHLSW
jgi:sialate O-acetylesterase